MCYKTLEITSGASGHWTVTTRCPNGKRRVLNIVVPVGKEFEYNSPSQKLIVHEETNVIRLYLPRMWEARVITPPPNGYRKVTQCDYDRDCAMNPFDTGGNAEVWRRMAQDGG
jgi:hypothetical protein